MGHGFGFSDTDGIIGVRIHLGFRGILSLSCSGALHVATERDCDWWWSRVGGQDCHGLQVWRHHASFHREDLFDELVYIRRAKESIDSKVVDDTKPSASA